MHIRINNAIAAIVITAMILVIGGWLALVLTKTISFDTGVQVASHFGAYLAGAFTPLVLYWKDRKIQFDLDSDPPMK